MKVCIRQAAMIQSYYIHGFELVVRYLWKYCIFINFTFKHSWNLLTIRLAVISLTPLQVKCKDNKRMSVVFWYFDLIWILTIILISACIYIYSFFGRISWILDDFTKSKINTHNKLNFISSVGASIEKNNLICKIYYSQNQWQIFLPHKN